MAGLHEVLADLIVKGKITTTSVPNKTGVPLIWNLESGDISHRTVVEFIEDNNLEVKGHIHYAGDGSIDLWGGDLANDALGFEYAYGFTHAGTGGTWGYQDTPLGSNYGGKITIKNTAYDVFQFLYSRMGDGKLWFRHLNNEDTPVWYEFWHSGNSRSDVENDTRYLQSYTETDPTVPAYTKALNSASKLLTEIKTVDGVGSGLDSDLLDGQHGAYYDHRIHGLGTNTTNGSPARVDINGDPITSLNDFYLSGFHQIDQGMNYTDGPYPSGGASRGAVLNFISHHSSLSQIFLSRENNEMWFRDGYGGWKPWVRIMTTGNIDEIVEGQGYVKEVTWTQVTGKPTEFNPTTHTHSWSQITDVPIFDNYQSWNLKTNGIQRTTVQSGGDLNLIQGSNITLSYSAGGGVTINSSYVDTTYSNMSLTELTTGTVTTARTISAKTLNDWVTSKGFLTGVSWAQITGKPTIPTKTSDLSNDSGFITGQEPAKVRVIFINPEDLPSNHTKADVVAYLTTNPVTKSKGETIIVRVGTAIAAPHWSTAVVDAYEARVLADYGIMEDKAELIEFLKQ